MTEKQRIPPQEVYRWEHIHWFPLRPSLRFSRWGARWRPDLSSSPLSSKQYQTWRGQTRFIHQHTFMKNSPLFTTPEKNRSGVFFSLALIVRPQTRARGMIQWCLHVSLLLWGDVDIAAVDELQILWKRLSGVM